jgi:uncharacterized membrane protein (UPF0127 family)
MFRAVAFLFMFAVAADAAALERFEKSEISIDTAQGSKTFQVEVAKTPKQQAQGLMYRRSMAADAGMLFVYESPQPASYWMKNTFIPLDMLFIGADGRIVNIRQRTVPRSLTPVRSDGDVIAVLELNGGTSARLGIKAGDRVRHTIFENRSGSDTPRKRR